MRHKQPFITAALVAVVAVCVPQISAAAESAEPVSACLNSGSASVGITVTQTASSLTDGPIDITLCAGLPNAALTVDIRPVGEAAILRLVEGTTDAQGDLGVRVTIPTDLVSADYEIIAAGAAIGATEQLIATFAIEPPVVTTFSETLPADPTDGALQLITSEQTLAQFSAPGYSGNLSLTTGTLGAFRVVDTRTGSEPGWVLTATVSDFVGDGPGALISATNLGILLEMDAASTASGVSRHETTAGSASYPTSLAEANAGSGLGESVFTGTLSLLAPATAPASTYRSTLTLTLVSR